MGLETATFISDLDGSFPLGGDGVDRGDDHLRLVKTVLKATFTNANAAFTATPDEFNKLAGLLTTAAELGFVAGLTSAIQVQLDLKAALAAPALTGAATLDTLPLVAAPAQITDHIKAGNTQIVSGNDATQPAFDIDTNITINTWESIGPTGSGATNIWPEMDVIPAEATILLVDVQMDFKNNGGASGIMTLYAVEGDISSPTVGTGNSRSTVAVGPITSNAEGRQLTHKTVLIPLGPTNQDFKMQWTQAGASDINIIMYYRGFMTA